jgi:hypothetical protein
MTTIEFLQQFISPSCHKVDNDRAEYLKIREQSVLIKATTFYSIYKHNVFHKDARLEMRDFFHVCGQYFYYDKIICEHGTEFYYHILFNEDNEIYQLTQKVIQKKIRANAPSTLKDKLYMYEAISPNKEEL